MDMGFLLEDNGKWILVHCAHCSVFLFVCFNKKKGGGRDRRENVVKPSITEMVSMCMFMHICVC